ncbi:MAG: Hsp20/alpha crystallin family protein [Curvibacter sp.]|nr:MAG: Hsp20/alpha crystallin family protein [Curvibacter sp.]
MNSLIPRGGLLLDEFFRDAAPGFYIRPLHGDPLPGPARIKVDVIESDDAYTVHAEVPGVAKEDLHVTLEGQTLSLSAEVRQQDQAVRDGQVLCRERYFGQVARSIPLPAEVDVSQARARYEDGVLTLTLPKRQASRAQRLRID